MENEQAMIRNPQSLLCSLLAALLLALPAAAGESEEPEILTDRPDFTETSFVVPRGSLQLEGGFTYTDEPGDLSVFNAPELLLRYGLASRTELRIGVPDYIREWTDRRSRDGFGDLYLGFKQQLGPSGAPYGFAVIPAVTVPVGSDRFSSNHVDPEVVLTWSRDLSEKWSVGGIFGFAWPTEDGDRSFNFFPTVSFGYSLSDRWGTFLEWAAEFPENGGNIHLLHHGYTYALNRTSQLDVHLGVGLTRAAPDFFIGAGYATQFR
jgi:outer membrane putative beta-barrel porin/alpha-amylase